jgi:hypothetical protein
MKTWIKAVMVFALIVAGTRSASAYPSASAFTPVTTTGSNADSNFIKRDFFGQGGAIYNGDSVNYHQVTTSIGMIGGNNYGITIFGSGNGLNFPCWAYARDLTTGTVYSATGQTSASGSFSFAFTLSIPANGHLYAANLYCSLPNANPSSAVLYGAEF